MTASEPARVLIDFDGVLADFDRGFLHVWRSLHPTRPWVDPAKRQHFRLRDDYPPAWREAVQAMAQARGWQVDRLRIDDGCYQIRGADETGQPFKVKIDPATLEIVKIKRIVRF